MSTHATNSIAAGLRITGLSVGINLLLATGKIVAGVFGNSYALVADGIESTADIFSSFIVCSGLRIAMKPADANHPYGHGKGDAGHHRSDALTSAAAFIAFVAVTFEKWIRFGGGRGENAIPEQKFAT